MLLKALIVDDELASRETIAHYLKKYCPDVQLAGMADGVASALVEIERTKPDIVFLDVEMPFGNAFDLLERVKDITFETVFVTAFSHYALKALNLSAAYYILKPIDIDELIAAVATVKASREKNLENVHAKIIVENIRTDDKQQQKLVLPVMEGFEVIRISDVIRCEANDNFTNFQLSNGKKMMICRTLKYYEDLLSSFGFMRIHKSHMINLQYVRKYHKGKTGSVVMSDNSELEISINKKEEFLEKFKMMM